MIKNIVNVWAVVLGVAFLLEMSISGGLSDEVYGVLGFIMIGVTIWLTFLVNKK